MYRSRTFLTQCKRLPRTTGPAETRTLEELFLKHLPPLPEGMGAEVFEHALQLGLDRDETAEPTGAGADPEETHQLLADLVDLLWMQYDDEADPLTKENWAFLRDLMDEYASELDLPMVQYVMERVVSHHAL